MALCAGQGIARSCRHFMGNKLEFIGCHPMVNGVAGLYPIFGKPGYRPAISACVGAAEDSHAPVLRRIDCDEHIQIGHRAVWLSCI
jgi:hypothetical protein